MGAQEDAIQAHSNNDKGTSTDNPSMRKAGSSRSSSATTSTNSIAQQGRTSFQQSGSLLGIHDFKCGLKDEASISSEGQAKELPFSTLGLVGRSNETQALHRIIDDMVPRPSSSNNPQRTPDSNGASPPTTSSAHDRNTMVLISGHSGSGKSALAMHFQHQCFERHAFFVSGKFDLKKMEEPYSGIKAALTNLCLQMLALEPSDDTSSSGYSTGTSVDDSQGEDPRRLSSLQSLLSNELSASEIEALSKVIPDIIKVVNTSGDNAIRAKLQRSPSGTSNTSKSGADGTTTTNTTRYPDHAQKNQMGYREQSERLKFAMRRFLQVVCQFCPVVMVIDDLQWGDKASMVLLQSWMFMDAGSSRTGKGAAYPLLIMGCFRSNDSDHNPLLQDAIEELKNAQEDRSINVVEVHLGDMGVSQVHELVCGLLLPPNAKFSDKFSSNIAKRDDSSQTMIGGDECRALASIVHKRTGGNVFFIKQFLYQLFHDGLIYYDLTAHRWAWKSETEIADNSAATTNVADMMKAKIQLIPAARQILPVAACLGATFSAYNLSMVIRSLSIHSDHATFVRETLSMPRVINDSWIMDVLQTCEREGLIESHRQGSNSLAAQKALKKKKTTTKLQTKATRNSDLYSFVHDKVQEASFSLIPDDCITELQYRVGEGLSSCLTPHELKGSIFMVASLLNLRHDLVPHTNRGDRRMKIAMLNKMAGERAVSCGAFQAALTYFKTAISLLPEDHWESQFRASLDLYSSVAECSFVVSDMDQVHLYATQVTDRDCSILDKIRAYHILIDAVFAEGNSSRGLNPVTLCLFVLSELGYNFPRNKVVQNMATLRGMLTIRRCAPKWTLQQFDDMPVCTDAKELAIMKTLSMLPVVSYFLKPDIVPLAIMKLVQHTLKHGISQHSVPSFCMLGLIVGYFMGDFHSARKLAHISLRLLDRVECPETKANAMLLACILCLHWTRPIGDGAAPLLESFQIGMATGEIEPAAWGIYSYIHTRVLIGTPLADVHDDASRYIHVVKDAHQTKQYHMCAAMWQMIQNLQGKSGNRTLLVGDAYDEVAELKRLETDPNPQRQAFINTMKLHAAVHFGDFADGAKHAAKTSEEHLKHHAGLLALPPGIFNASMCCYVASFDKSVPSKLRKKYRRTAQKCRGKLREWQGKGNINCDHYIAILDAEHCAVKLQYESAIKNYAVAIALAKSRGYIQYEALANERLADHLLQGDSGDEAKAHEYMRNAIDLTDEWGATAKVEILCGKYSSFLEHLPALLGNNKHPDSVTSMYNA